MVVTPKSSRESGNQAEDFAVDEYKKMGCRVQKVYLRAGYAGPGKLFAKPGDFFLTLFLDDNGDPELDSKGKPKKGGVIDVIAVCPDAVYLDSITSAKIENVSKNMSNVHLRQRHIDQGFAGEFVSVFRVTMYIDGKRNNKIRWRRKAVGDWFVEERSEQHRLKF